MPAIANEVHDMPMMPTTDWAIETGQFKDMVQACLACVTFVDHYIGEVLNALETSKYKDNTIVILWSDHGYRYIHYEDGSEELYNRNTDPNEFENIAGKSGSPEIKSALAKYLPAKNEYWSPEVKTGANEYFEKQMEEQINLPKKPEKSGK